MNSHHANRHPPSPVGRARLCLVAILLAGAAIAVPSASNAAVACSYDSSNFALSIFLNAAGDVATIVRDPQSDQIIVNGMSCLSTSNQSATVEGTLTINVDAANASGSQTVNIDISGGNFFNTEFQDEILFGINLGESAGDADLLQLSGSSAGDDLFVGDRGEGFLGVAINNIATGDPDDSREVDATGVEFVTLVGHGGNDTLSGAGEHGTGTTYDGPIFFTGNEGSDKLIGGSGDDTFFEGTAPNGSDEFFGGAHINGDTIDYCARTGAVSADADDVADDGEAGEGDNVHLDVEIISVGLGCPNGDADGDGVLNANDACPTVPGPPSNNGCPLPTPTPTPTPSPTNTIPNCEADVCGTTDDDDITVNDGDVETGDGDDTITLEIDGGTQGISVFCGGGSDTVILDLSSAPDADVDIHVDCASGNDDIKVPDDPGGVQGVFLLGGGDDMFSSDDGSSPASARMMREQSITTGSYKVSGGGGNDIVTTGLGWDNLIGGRGRDRLDGSRGRDSMSGGLGFDFVEGGGGNDVMKGAAGRDVLHGSGGANKMKGGKGRDRCLSDTGRDSFSGCERIVRNHRRNH